MIYLYTFSLLQLRYLSSRAKTYSELRNILGYLRRCCRDLGGERTKEMAVYISAALFVTSIALAALGKYVASLMALLGGFALISYASIGGTSQSET